MSIWFTNEWVHIENAIDKKTCDRIKKLAQSNWENSTVNILKHPFSEEEHIHGRKPVYEPDNKTRISDVYWTTEQWLYDLIWPFMLEANKSAGWNLDISAAEDIQITRYKKGGFYNWHRDGISDSLSAYDRPNKPLMHGNVRKMSVSLMLNDDYEGGEFEFSGLAKGECEITSIKNLKAGDMLFFTSGMEHRVTPVTKGVRYSLVNWFVGPPVR